MLDTSVTFGTNLDGTATIVAGALDIELSFFGTTVDAALSATSTNPVQNNVINTALGLKITAPTTALSTQPADANYFAIFTTSWLQLPWLNLKTWLRQIFKTYCGFENRTDSTITAADSGGWKVTIAPVGASFTLWSGGVKRTYTTAQVIAVPTDLTLYYIYFDSDGVIQTGTDIWDFESENAPAAIFYRDGTAYALTDERHHYARNRIQHGLDHNTIGARYKSGLTGSFLNDSFSVTQGVIYDEDIRFDTGGTKTACTIWHRATTLDKMRFTRNNVTIYPTVGGQLAWDNAGTLAALGANQYGVYWVYASNDPSEPIYSVASQATYANLNSARNAASPTIYLSTAEWKLLYRVIYRNTSPITYIEAADFRTVQTGTPITATTQDHSALINRDALNSHPATAITFTIEELTGADTIVAADSGKHFYSTAASDYNLTLDSGLTHPISIFQKGNGVVTVISGSGTPTLVGNVKTGGANTAIAIVPESTTVYEVIGGVA
jgi:hypothetical protein